MKHQHKEEPKPEGKGDLTVKEVCDWLATKHEVAVSAVIHYDGSGNLMDSRMNGINDTIFHNLSELTKLIREEQ